jgi:hypothetical protein
MPVAASRGPQIRRWASSAACPTQEAPDGNLGGGWPGFPGRSPPVSPAGGNRKARGRSNHRTLPKPLLVHAGVFAGQLACQPTLPAGLGYGLVDGLTEGGIAEIAHHVLQPGDRLFCITDGVVDSHRPGGEDFGIKRLTEWLNRRSQAGLDTAETVRQLSHTVLDHHGVLSDDTTAFLIDFH